MRTLSSGEENMKISEKRCVVLDMDGTVYLGSIPITGAVDFIKKYWDTLDFYFLSNNTSKSPDTYVKRLNSMGIPATLDLILSPTTPLVDFLKENGILAVFHYVPLHSAPAGLKFGRFHGEDRYTTNTFERLLRLPMYYGLEAEKVEYICDKIKEFYR